MDGNQCWPTIRGDLIRISILILQGLMTFQKGMICTAGLLIRRSSGISEKAGIIW